MAKVKDEVNLSGSPVGSGTTTDLFRELLRSTLQEFMEEEISRHLGATRSERTETRRGYRNGYKPRSLNTRLGTMDFEIPQDRDGEYYPSFLERFSRSEKALCLAVHEMIVQGVSTRRVDKIASELGIESLSRSTASRIAAMLDEQVGAWLSRELTGPYPYVMVDAKYEKVREGHRVVSRGVLIVVGIDAQGFRDILGVYVADSESEESWSEVFLDLKRRGLDGVQLVISDHHEGLRRSVERHFDGACWQRCGVHYLRNASAKLSLKDRRLLMARLGLIWQQETVQEARAYVQELAEDLNSSHPEFSTWLEETVEDTLTVYAFPREYRKRLYSNNMLERLNQELERRGRPVRIFPNRTALLRLHATICMETAEDWSDSRAYLRTGPSHVEEGKPHRINISKPFLQKI
jgi:putative transposase